MNLGKNINKTDIISKLTILTTAMDNSCDYQVHFIMTDGESVWNKYYSKVHVDVYNGFRDIF
jgi:hypothetical protein